MLGGREAPSLRNGRDGVQTFWERSMELSNSSRMTPWFSADLVHTVNQFLDISPHEEVQDTPA